MTRSCLAFVALTLLLGAHRLSAQQEEPRASFGAAVGYGPHAREASGIAFDDRNAPMVRLSLGWLGESGRARPVLRAEVLVQLNSTETDCVIAAGGCPRHFPDNDGVGASLGMDVRLVGGLSMEALIGRGRYGKTTRTFGELELAYAFGRHVMLTASARHMRWNEPDAGRLWYRPVFVGLRLR